MHILCIKLAWIDLVYVATSKMLFNITIYIVYIHNQVK